MLSRKNEFEADAYAAEVTGKPEELITGSEETVKGQSVESHSASPARFLELLASSRDAADRRIGGKGIAMSNKDQEA